MKNAVKPIVAIMGLVCLVLGSSQLLAASDAVADGDGMVLTSKQTLGMPVDNATSGENATSGDIETRDQKIRDAWLKGKLDVALALNRHLNPFRIHTDVTAGIVTLRGDVESDIDKELAGELAKSIDGVDAVHNKLAVDPETERRDNGNASNNWQQAIADMTTSAVIKTKLLAHSGTAGLAIEVTTRNDVVSLEGDVKMDQERDLAELIASNTEGVEKVRNRLRVKTGS